MVLSRSLCKTAEQIELLRLNNVLVARTLAELALKVVPGVQTKSLDKHAEEFIRDNGAVPGFLGYDGFPFSLCISVNDVVVHGFPSEYELKEGDIVSIDCGTLMHGFYGDSAFTFCVGEVSIEAKHLVDVTRNCLELGIQAIKSGARTGDIGFAVQTEAESNGYGVVREMVGHGLGKDMHESPEVPNFGKKGSGKLLKPGMVICIEPMVTLGARNIYQDKDGWTIRTRDHKLAAHFERAVAINESGFPDVLTPYDIIDAALCKKS